MLLEISQLNTFYGRLHALWDVNMKVEKGTIVALIAPTVPENPPC